ncbi:MAG: molybdenum cofactor biosynthesis protein MoaE [Thermomicrobiales bacterium]
MPEPTPDQTPPATTTTTTTTISVHTHYFAMMRELLGSSGETLTLPAGSTAKDAFAVLVDRHPRLAGMERAVMLMVNETYVRGTRVLQDGDELAFIPPVSGGSGAQDEASQEAAGGLPKLFIVTADPIDPRAVEALVAGPDAGAICTFTGTVRDNARDKDVIALDYEAYVPAAEKMLAHIGLEIVDRWPGVRTAITHRTGLLQPGEASVVIACASAHRAASFAAAAYAIDRIKEIVPIWKKESYDDGSSWIGSEAEYQQEIGRLPRGLAEDA